MNNIEELFNFSLTWKNDKPVFRFLLKDLSKISLRRKDGMPYSQSQFEYFEHHIKDINIARNAFDFRRKFFNMNVCLDYFEQNKLASIEDCVRAREYLNKKFSAGKAKQREAMKKPEVLKKIRASNIRTTPIRAQQLSENWKVPENRERYIAAIKNPTSEKKRIEGFLKYINENYDEYKATMNTPSRLEKISLASSKMWQNFSAEDKKKFLPRPGRKSHTLDGNKMNSIEFRFAKALSNRGIKWIYEKPFTLDDKSTIYPDFFLPEFNTVIELNGNFWHGNPQKYSDDCVLFENVTAKMLQERVAIKYDIYRNVFNLTVEVLWESDLDSADSFIDKIVASKFIEEEITLADFAKKFLNNDDFTNPCIIDVDNIAILSHKDGKNVFSPMTQFVIKDKVDVHFKLGELHGTSAHRVWVDGEWISLKNHPKAIEIAEPMNVVDISVPETECYIANGQINHNTTSGGMAIPFHSSVRIALSGGSKIENKDGEVIGINVIARTIKNKVAPPHKKVMFQIHFGKGIREHEELFDVLREAGPQEVDGKQMVVEGTGAWKTFKVTDLATKTVLVEKKFTKSGFCEVLDDLLYKSYLDDLIEKVLVSHTTTGFAETAAEVDEDGVVINAE